MFVKINLIVDFMKICRIFVAHNLGL